MAKLFNDEFLDALAVVGFIVGLMNYEENLSQSDKDDIIQKAGEAAHQVLEQLEKDLDTQNEMLQEILSRLEKLEQKGE